MIREYSLPMGKMNGWGYAQGVALTLVLSVTAKYLSNLSLLHIMGQLVIAIILGISWRAAIGVPEGAMGGISFSSKKLLRCGIILLGMRLNLADMAHAGARVFAIAVINVVFTLFAVYGIAKLFKVTKRLGILTACSTAICGAAAVVAIAPLIKADDDETAIGAATAAILGTIFTLAYTLLYPVLGWTDGGYGIFAGATLHEVAHVIAAAAPGGKEAVDLALIVKLTRVAMLVPVAIIIGIGSNRAACNRDEYARQANRRPLPIPWFIIGFLLMSGVNTLGAVPAEIANGAVVVAYLLIAMAMAGLGLNVDLASFRRLGMKPFAAGLIGSVLLSGLGFVLVTLFSLN